MIKFLLFREIGITKSKLIRKIILFYFKNNIKINYPRILDDNIKVYDFERFDTKFWFSDE